MQSSYNIPPFDGSPVEHLLAAVRARNFDLVDRLLPNVGINAKDDTGATPLYAAASSSSHEMVLHLLAQGADITIGNDYGTPLTWFAKRGWLDLIERCLVAGHKPFEGAEKHRSAFVTAAESGHTDAMKLLVASGYPDDARKAEQLAEAFARCSKKHVAELIVDLGLDPHTPLEGGETPLFTLTRHGATESCAQLIERGADVNHRAEGYAALYYAPLYDKPETMLALLQAGAEEESISPQGENLAQAVAGAKRDTQQAYAAFLARRSTASVVAAAVLRANAARS